MTSSHDSQGSTPTGATRVLHVVDSLGLGGAEQATVHLAQRQREAGIDASIVHAASPRTAVDGHDVPFESISMRHVEGEWGLRFAVPVSRAIGRYRPSLVHGHMFTGSVAAIVAARATGTAVVITDHSDFAARTATQRTIARLAYPLAGRVVAVSHASGAALARSIGLAKVTVVLSSIQPSVVRRSRPAGLRAAAGDHPCIGVIGRFEEKKGIRYLLQALPPVLDRVPGARLQVVGEGPEERLLREEAAACGVEAAVRFAGTVDDVATLLHRLDILALPSLTESNPRIVLEAMEAGVPVVASEVGGVPHQLDGAGLLVPPGDPHALADALVHALRRPDEMRGMALRARRRLDEEFDFDRVVRQTNEVYEEVLGTRLERDMPPHATGPH